MEQISKRTFFLSLSVLSTFPQFSHLNSRYFVWTNYYIYVFDTHWLSRDCLFDLNVMLFSNCRRMLRRRSVSIAGQTILFSVSKLFLTGVERVFYFLSRWKIEKNALLSFLLTSKDFGLQGVGKLLTLLVNSTRNVFYVNIFENLHWENAPWSGTLYRVG